MLLPALKSRYDAFAGRVLCSLSEIERRDVEAFDRWFYTGGGWRWPLALVALTTAIAWVASRLPWNMGFVEAGVLFNLLVLTLLWVGMTAWFGYRKLQGKLVRFIVVGPLLAVPAALVGATIARAAMGEDPLGWIREGSTLRHFVTAGLVFAFLCALLVALIANLRNREYAALAAHLEADARQSELARQLAESKLKLLQLQIEPHFLFNTLGSAQQLAEKGAPDAARLIADLIRFLRAAAPSMHGESATLAQEAALAGAYLGIMKARLGARLTWTIAIAPDLDAAAIAPGMIITLVENAIKHGIEPAAEGGTVAVTATRERAADGDRLVIAVADTGNGLAGTPGQGIGLANIRERLALLHGARARLELEANVPRGFVATMTLPLAGA